MDFGCLWSKVLTVEGEELPQSRPKGDPYSPPSSKLTANAGVPAAGMGSAIFHWYRIPLLSILSIFRLLTFLLYLEPWSKQSPTPLALPGAEPSGLLISSLPRGRHQSNCAVRTTVSVSITASMTAVSTSPAVPKAIIFDYMGTCLDWYGTAVLPALQRAPQLDFLPPSILEEMAKNWRIGFFREIQTRYEAGQPVEDIDITHRRVLNRLLLDKGVTPSHWDDDVRKRLVHAWHEQKAWPDVLPALQRLREKYFVVVLANGSTRLQLDLAKSSDLPFHALFSSQLLGKTKPDAAMYRKALDLMQIRPVDAVMVAAHAYDLRAAKEVGLKTVYVKRWSEDFHEDMEKVESEVDIFIRGKDSKEESGSGMFELVDLLQT